MPQVAVSDSWAEVIGAKRRKLLILGNPGEAGVSVSLGAADADDGIVLSPGEKLRLEMTAMDRDQASVSVWAKAGSAATLDYIERT